MSEQAPPVARHSPALTWALKHPGAVVAIAAGALAIVRLLVVSRGNLSTAQVLLEHSDVSALAAGLLISAAVFWIPVVVAILLNFRTYSIGTIRWFAFALMICFAGAYFVADLGDLDSAEIANGGIAFVILALLIGGGLGSVVAMSRADSVEPDKDATPLHDSQPQPASPAGADANAPQEPEPDANGDSAHTDIGPLRRALRAMGRIVSLAGGGLFAALALLFVLALAFLLLSMVFFVLSVPSQPAENLTVRTSDGETTITAHVIVDESDEWVIMSRRDRSVLSLTKSQVRDRYICATVDLPHGLEEWVQKNVLSRSGALGTPAALRAEIDSKENGDGQWLKELTDNPPPCDLRLSSQGVNAVRAALGVECSQVDRCR